MRNVGRRRGSLISLSLALILALVVAQFGLLVAPTVAQTTATTFYVSKSGSGGDGRSWATAWRELSDINWAAVQPGDTIVVDGGASSMTYNSTLTVGKSGVAGKPITIRLASEAGRNGQAIIFGGRSTPLPYCGQTGYNGGTQRAYGIDLRNRAWVVVDGTKWRGITIHGSRWGIAFSGSSADVTVRNLEIYDAGGWQQQSDGTYKPWDEAVQLAGARITLERMILHDNGQDAIQDSGQGISNFTLRDSWLYNSRKKPDGSFWNYCTHPDGIQVWGGGEQSGMLVENSVIGPGFMQGILLGDAQTAFHDVTVRNTLLYGNGNANFQASPNQPVKSRNWRIENVTSDRPVGAKWTNVGFQWANGLGDPGQLTITNSIFTGGYGMWVPAGGNYSGNVQWNLGQTQVGRNADPKYANPSVYGSNAVDADFSLAAGSTAAGLGARITSAKALLAGQTQAPAAPAPTPQPSPTATPAPSPVTTPAPTPNPAPQTLPGLAWEAEAGTIGSPFTVGDGVVSQAVQTTDPAAGGSAVYRFNLPEAGDYLVAATLDAPNLGANSLFVNVDGQPQASAIWDIPVTTGLQDRVASWRGSGSENAPQFLPKVFTLFAGEHSLILRGREAGVRIDKVRVQAVPRVTFEAESGAIAKPFNVSGGSLLQPQQTLAPNEGGRAVYQFKLPIAGRYVVKAVVKAPDTASNSLFFNLDAEPQATMLWDIEVNPAFTERVGTWRGTGTESTPQFAPKVFNLAAGEHQLIIRGRERNTAIDRITVQMVP